MSKSIYQQSTVEAHGTTYFLVCDPLDRKKYLALKGDPRGFEGGFSEDGLFLAPLTPANARALRARLAWLRPTPLGLSPSFGFGDRLGLATPGHVRAVCPTGIAPIFAQQSVRENARTGRAPQEVLDDAMWGVFQEGWRGPWGADADHLKTPEDLAAFVRSGYSFFTVDPGDLVVNKPFEEISQEALSEIGGILQDQLGLTKSELYRLYRNKSFHLEGLELKFDEYTLLGAVIKYGPAIGQTARMHRRLKELMGSQPFDFELSMDETASPTTIHEHFFVASELKRLGIDCTSLALRLVGEFEKGVDYIGDLGQFETSFNLHAKIQRYFGSYKISLHSGSDKFSVYPYFSKYTQGRFHVKTAGTSYLEALRVIADVEPAFFREILACSRERYPIDRASYIISARVDKMPAAETVRNAELALLLNQFDTREVLHVTYGSILSKWGERLKAVLRANEEVYALALARHLTRHLVLLHPTGIQNG